MLELTSLHNILNSMGDTAVHTDNGTRSRKTKCHNNIFDWVKPGFMHLSMSSPRGGPRAYVGHLTSIDPYHVPDILDLKRGWTGINNAYAIFRMHNLF